MIQIAIEAKGDLKARVDEIYEAVRQETRVWKMGDLRRTRNIKLVHKVRDISGTVRRVRAKDGDALHFECKSQDPASEAITAGRFVHMVLRYMSSVRKITLEPA
jgi:hypothetical protein